MKSWEDIRNKAKELSKQTISVARAEDSVVLTAIKKAKELGLIDATLVGDENKIKELLKELNMNFNDYKIINVASDKEAAMVAVKEVHDGKADSLMKGLIKTSILLKAVLDKENGLRSGKLLSHILVTEARGKLYFVTDGGMNMYPDVSQKAAIIENAVGFATKMGIKNPLVSPLCAVETVNPDMRATLDATILSKMNDRGQIKNCTIDGPLALDNSVSVEAAKHKKIVSPVAGNADILLVPDIETGNIFGKCLIYFAKAKVGGIIAGASAPIILLSRADDEETKLNSICLAKLVK
jgi:phosphate butyryltransferase